jgi:hypothetical protein
MNKSAQFKAYISHLIDRYESGGYEVLEESERAYLALLFAGDVRKGEFAVEGEDDVATRRRFCAHVRQSFLEAEFRVVLDHRDTIATQAKALADERRPLASLILYATWVEHWLNAVVVTTAIHRGIAPDLSEQIVRDAPLRAKLTWLLQLAGLPPLHEEHRKAIVSLTDLRNAYVHYKWSGRTPEELAQEEERLRQTVQRAEALLDYLREYEREHISGEMPQAAKRLFGVDIEAVRSGFRPLVKGDT